MSIGVAIVDDEPDVWAAFDQMCLRSHTLRPAGAYSSAQEALIQVPRNRPQAVLMDILMPGISGIECTRRLKDVIPSIPIVMFTAVMDRRALLEALFAGASGYLVKGTALSELEQEITEVLELGAVLSRRAIALLVGSFHQWHWPSGPLYLTAREQQIIAFWFDGLRDKEIADKLRISPASVHTHTALLFARLGVHCRHEAVLKILGGGQAGVNML